MDAKERRPRIGFQITRITTGYCAMYLPSIMEFCRDAGADLTIFAGGSLLAPFPYDYQLNTVYGYVNPANIDAIILLTSTLKSYVPGSDFDEFLTLISGMPTVSISFPLDGCASLLVDNESGLARAIRHLVNDHGRKRIAFIRGPENNDEALERYGVYTAVLGECGIAFDPELVCRGDFTPRTGTKAIETLIDERRASFDALVAANDDMALGAMQELQARGIAVPDDVSVIGFDDLAQAAYTKPGLTTVRQPFREQARKAVELALKAIVDGANGVKESGFHGASAPVLSFRTELVTRSSCGCFPRSLEMFDAVYRIAEIMKADTAEPSFERCLSYLARLERPPFIDEATRDRDAAFLFGLFWNLLDTSIVTREFLSCIQAFAGRDDQTPESLLFWEQILCLVSVYCDGKQVDQQENFRAREKARILFREARTMIMNRNHYRLIDEAEKYQTVIQRLLLARDLSELRAALPGILALIDIRTFFLVLHPPIKTEPSVHSIKPMSGRKAVFGIIDGASAMAGSIEIPGPGLLPDSLMGPLGEYQLVASALYDLEELFGYVCYTLGSHSVNLYDNFILELGSVIRRCLMGTRQIRTQRKLVRALGKIRETNQKLANLSQTDELTGLHNRRGFLELAEHGLLLTRRMRKTAMLFFIDLDGLKAINDTWGHSAGDCAIKGAAFALASTFRQADAMARIGGDEFVVLALDSLPSARDTILARLVENTESFNRVNAKPWALSMSVGALVVEWDDVRPLDELIKIADELQYREKVAKRKNRPT